LTLNADVNSGDYPDLVMPGLSRSKNGVASLAYVPGIHVLAEAALKAWMAGTSPAMTENAEDFGALKTLRR
jgi:hypothetical protein